MVTNFTANQIGDQIFAKLQEPYLDTLRVLNWGILAGVSSANTIGTLQITEGSINVIGTGVNLDLVPGDRILVGSNVLEVATVAANNFTITIPATFSAAPQQHGIKLQIQIIDLHTNGDIHKKVR